MTGSTHHHGAAAAHSSRTGEACKLPPLKGSNVCRSHGGAAPQVKRKARQRIEEAADRMACELLKMATDDNVADSVKLAAIRDALDRAGLAAKNAVEVEWDRPSPTKQSWRRSRPVRAPNTAAALANTKNDPFNIQKASSGV